MKRIYLLTFIYLIIVFSISAHKRAIIKLYPEAAVDTIPHGLYGLLINNEDDLITGGLWVGDSSEIAHTDGYRNDALMALRALNVPLLRWVDFLEKDTVESKRFDKNEFVELCKHLHCAPAEVRGVALQRYIVPKYRNKTIPLFGETPIDDSYFILSQTLHSNKALQEQCAVLDRQKEENKQLIINEWGILPDVSDEERAQQSTLRDAIMVAMCLNIFHQHRQRLKMANLALVTNNVPALLITKKNRLAVTPTYHVLKMYSIHQNARFVPLEVVCDTLFLDEEDFLPFLSATASIDAKGKMTLSVSNIDLDREQTVTINLNGMNIGKVTSEILTAQEVTTSNSVDEPDNVTPTPFFNLKMRKEILTLRLPAKSVVNVVLEKIPVPLMLFGKGELAVIE